MLDKKVERRYCKFDQIKSHRWFKDFNWEDLISLDMKPAFLPQLPNIEMRCNPMPYLDFIRTCKDWEPEGNERPTPKDRKEFEIWWDKF